MAFRNRAEAAHKLAERLSAYKGKNPLVLAIPRGAVPMARILADALGGELDVVLVRKLGAPMNPEFALVPSTRAAGRMSLTMPPAPARTPPTSKKRSNASSR